MNYPATNYGVSKVLEHFVTLNFDMLEAYKIRYILTLSGPGLYE